MAYSTGGTILDNHYNDFVNDAANNLNNVWGTGTGDAGYGQTNTLSTVSAGATVTATQWSTFLDRLEDAAAHQGSSITTYPGPTTGETISALAAISSDLATTTTNRTDHGGTHGTQAASTASSSGAGTWSVDTVHIFNINFDGGNEVRHFFNAGGEIWITVTSSTGGNNKELDWEDLLETDVGMFKLKANSVARTGSGTIDTEMNGYYAMTASSSNTLFKMFSNGSPYTANYFQVACNPGAAHADGLGNVGNNLQFTVTLADPHADDSTVSTTITSTIDIKTPDTTNLNNSSWGTITDTFTSFTQT